MRVRIRFFHARHAVASFRDGRLFFEEGGLGDLAGQAGVEIALHVALEHGPSHTRGRSGAPSP